MSVRLSTLSLVILSTVLSAAVSRAQSTECGDRNPVTKERRGTLLAGPYLLGPTPNDISIRWEYAGMVSSAVVIQGPSGAEWRVEGRMMKPLAPLVSLPGRVYEAEVGDLMPCTTYRYRLEPRDKAGFPYHFRTPPEAGHRCHDGTRFAIYGNSRTQHMEHKIGVLTLSRFSPDYLIHLGDFVYKARRVCEWLKFFSIEKELLALAPINAVPGNQEGYKDPEYGEAMMQRYFVDGFTDGVGHFSVDRGLVHFTILDQYWGEDLSDGGPGQAWLERDLASVPVGRYKVVLMHEAPITLGHYVPKPYSGSLMQIFEKYQVQLVCSAHAAIYEHFLRNGIHYLTLGGMGAPFQKPRERSDPTAEKYLVKTGAFAHFLLVEEGDAVLVLKIVEAEEGETVEQFTLLHSSKIPTSVPAPKAGRK